MSSNRIAEEEYSFKDMEPQQVKNTKKPGSDIRGQRQRKHPEEAQEDSEKDTPERNLSVHRSVTLGQQLNLSAFVSSLLFFFFFLVLFYFFNFILFLNFI